MYSHARNWYGKLTYSLAQTMLGNRQKRRLASNTYLEWCDGNPVVRLYYTNIITFKPNGNLILSTGRGRWQTVTTKDRLSSCLGYGFLWIESVKGDWYLKDKSTEQLYRWGSRDVEVTSDGKIVNLKPYVTEYLEEITEIRLNLESTDVMSHIYKWEHLNDEHKRLRRLFRVGKYPRIDAHVKTLCQAKRKLKTRAAMLLADITDLDILADLMSKIRGLVLEYSQVRELVAAERDFNRLEHLWNTYGAIRSVILKHCIGAYVPIIAATAEEPWRTHAISRMKEG